MKHLAITALLLLSACSYITHPVPYGLYNGMRDGAPEGSDSFREGWKAGCESGLSALGSLHYKYTHHYTFDETQLQNDEYLNAWRNGFRHCRWYVSVWDRQIYGPLL